VPLDDIRDAGYVLTPGRYVDAPTPRHDGEPADHKISRLRNELLAALDESTRTEMVVRQQLERLR
jgi:type I restriction enzyme M protein